MVEAWSSSYTSSWRYHTCQDMSRISHLRSFVSMENGCAGAGKNFVFRTCGGPTQWCMMRVSLESVEVRWGALRIDVAGVWNDGFLWIFDVWDDVSMMIHWIGVQMELLKTMFLISICQFWRQQGRPEGSLFLVKLHHPQDSRGSPRYGMFAVIFSHATVNYAEKSSRNEAPTCPVHWQ